MSTYDQIAERMSAEYMAANAPRKVYRPHDGQLQVHRSPAKIRVLICGGGWGKTYAAVGEALARCGVVDVPGVEHVRGTKVVIVGPTYKMSPIPWDIVEDLVPPGSFDRMNRQSHEVVFPDGCWVRIRSADNPDSLRGEHPDLWVLDEAAQYKPSVYTRIIAPRSVTVGRAGKLLILTTPKGKNWVYRLVNAMKAGEQSDGQIFHYTAYDSPYVDAAGLATVIPGMTNLDVRQEIMAEFVDDTGGIFAGLSKCIRPGTTTLPGTNTVLYVGMDHAQTHDYSVIAGVDQDGEVRAVERFQGPLGYQISRAQSFAARYGGIILMDATGGGSQVLQAMQDAGVAVQGFTISSTTKPALINRLVLSIGNGDIRIPEDQEQLIDELEAYAYTRMPSGSFRYEAPEGQHDDCVIALALANWQRHGGSNAVGPIMEVAYTNPGRDRTPLLREKPEPDKCNHSAYPQTSKGCGCRVCGKCEEPVWSCMKHPVGGFGAEVTYL